MDYGLKKTLLGLVMLSAILFGAGMLIFRNFLANWYFGFFPFLIVIFFLVNTGFFISFYRTVNKPDNQFIRGFMVSKLIKLMIYLSLVLIYVIAAPKSAVPFAVTLSVLYIAYTSYDIYIMTGLVKRKKENPSLPNQFSI
jgi:hypothetical protein